MIVPSFSITVPLDYVGACRLDKYISSIPEGMNRSRLKTCATNIFVNDKKQKLSFKIKANDRIYIEWQDNVPDDIMPEDIPLDILYEE